MQIHPGDILAGYRVTHLLGRGGMGEVWAAVGIDPARHPNVAIKVLNAKGRGTDEIVRRFEREARICAAIESAYVCQLFGTVRGPDGAHVLILEHLVGETLSQRLAREQCLALDEVSGIVEDVLQGLSAAHSKGIIHRDLKPGNIFLEQLTDDVGGRRSERAKVLDFGVSKLVDSDDAEMSLTADDSTLGSVAYMAPEQIRDAQCADARSDLYSLGAAVYRALAGRLPFDMANTTLLVALKLERPAPSLADVTGEKWPAKVEAFLANMLATDPDCRFDSADEALGAWRTIGAVLREPIRRSSSPPPFADDEHTITDSFVTEGDRSGFKGAQLMAEKSGTVLRKTPLRDDDVAAHGYGSTWAKRRV